MVLACATSMGTQVQHFLKSFENHAGWDARIIGMGMKWDSYRTKMACYRDALKQMDRRQVVVCLDAYDALCVRDSAGLLETFYSYGAPVVVGYEPLCCFTLYNRFFQIGCCPNIDEWKAFHKIPRKEPIYVNSGCIVGYASEIHAMMDWILAYTGFTIRDDQIGVGMYMNAFPQKVWLDLDNRLVFNDNFGRRLPIKETGKGRVEVDLPHRPFFLHFPGIKYVYKKNNYQTICSALLGVEAPLHETVRDGGHHVYLYTGVFLALLAWVLFVIYRKK